MKRNFRKFKTCPGCGGKKLNAEISGPTNQDYIWIHCNTCGFSGPCRLRIDGAIKAWNRRSKETDEFIMEKPTPIW